ncbi:MAG: hemerythrin domain-containing protein [Ramlibacter sp.]
MNASVPPQHPVDLDAPLTEFSQCHAGIVKQLHALSGLPGLVEAAARAREVATGTVALFKGAVIEHHAEEESDLFPAVVRSAVAGEERDRVQVMVDRLTAEHRELEALWKKLEPAVKDAARGKPAAIDPAVAADLVQRYLAHAHFEEQSFLPLAETILRRNGDHMAALGLSLHLRHAPQPVGYI